MRADDLRALARRILRLPTVEEIERELLDGHCGVSSRSARVGTDVSEWTCSRRRSEAGVGVSDDVTRVEKPWGYELHWAKTDRYVGKLIHVNAGHALSLQYHNLKDETIYLQSGRLLFEIQEGGELVKREMLPGERVHITPKTIHRMTAIEDSDIFEVSTPELHDVVRLEDRYGRKTRQTREIAGSRIEIRNRSDSRILTGFQIQKGISSSVSGSDDVGARRAWPAHASPPRSIDAPRPPPPPPSSTMRSPRISVV